MSFLRTLGLFTWALFEVAITRLRRGPRVSSWSFGLEVSLRYLRLAWDRTAGWPPSRQRADVDSRPYPRHAPASITITDGVLAGLPARTCTPLASRSRSVVLFFHGGSYVYGSARTSHAELLARLAETSGVEVVGVDYRLAPEHPFPAQHLDARAAFDALVARGIDASRIVLAGDSAGGNLAISLALSLRDEGRSLPRALALVSPWADLMMPGASFVENDRYDFGTREVLARQARMYAGHVPLDDPRISPIRASLNDLPRTLVMVGQREIPRDDALALADALAAAGVDVTRHVAPDMPHDPPMFAAHHPAGAEALDVLARFVAR